MPDRPVPERQRRSPPAIRKPRVPPGQRLVREQGWLTTDHPEARWYRLIGHSADWSEVRLQVTSHPDAEPAACRVMIRPDGYVLPVRGVALPGAEAIRIIATAIRAGQRG